VSEPTLELTESPEPCDLCGEGGGVLLLSVAGVPWIASLALCAACRIKAEAILRGARKRAPARIHNWRD
jgi:hypothetical protein